MSSDIAVGNITALPSGAPISKKPSWLVVLEEGSAKTKVTKRFITLDKPQLLQGFIEAKGMFSELPEEEIIKSFSEFLTSSPKDLILEVLIPWHKISYMRSLVFKQK